MKKLFILIVIIFIGCKGQNNNINKNEPAMNKKNKTEAEWREILTPEEYEVLRNKGTERPFTGKYYKHFEKGVYVCAACEAPLFTSDAKFDSECGWPSFDQSIEGSVIYYQDNSYGMKRTEVVCANCGGHLGHVFNDGPRETTGQRYCTNSVSIKFIPEN